MKTSTLFRAYIDLRDYADIDIDRIWLTRDITESSKEVYKKTLSRSERQYKKLEKAIRKRLEETQ